MIDHRIPVRSMEHVDTVATALSLLPPIDSWTAIEAIGVFLVPAILVFGGYLRRRWHDHEERIEALEDRVDRHGRTIYGDEEDARHHGLVEDITRIEDDESNDESDDR